MNMSRPLDNDRVTNKSPFYFLLLIAAYAALVFIFRDSLTYMVVNYWDLPEYSHGYLIPMVALFLLWQRVNLLPAATENGSWWGFVLVLLGFAAFLLGELSAIYTLIQYGFLVCIFGVALSLFGRRGSRLLWVVFAYLIFMIPLPNFLYFNLSSQLQLISSQIGVAVIRLFGISVFLEGNVIDLGPMQLQVAEACSGMRYLFPLMSFGFLIAYLYRGPLWQRALIFLTTIPITIFMNSFRIGVIGVTVDRWGTKMAEGFLHDFEGWVVFMGCLGILFLEIMLFHIFSKNRRPVLDLINLDLPPLTAKLNDFPFSAKGQRPFLAVCVAIALLTPPLLTVNERPENIPSRKTFDGFPMQYDAWRGQPVTLDTQILDTLKLSDYLQANYDRKQNEPPINFYIAWYDTQRKGVSIHSPRTCIPGGGWRITSLTQRELPTIKHVSGKPLVVNRALIQKGDVGQLVYYWFEGRNRNITNEYAAKWFIFWDSLLHSHTNGALVRVVTLVPDMSKLDEADQRSTEFLQDFYPLLHEYTP